jgi:hypothetical protein
MIGSATHGQEPGDTSPGSAAPWPEFASAFAAFGQELGAALVPVVEKLAAAFNLIGEAVSAAFGSLVSLIHAVWDVDACLDYAVSEMGVTRADVRAVVLLGHRRCPGPHVLLWNRRRIPFPAGSGPAIAWSPS